MRILILSCGTRCLLVKYFMDRANGFDQVITTDCDRNAPALYFSDKYYIVERMTSPSYQRQILDICEKERIDVVLPLQEDELILTARNRQVFLNHGIIPCISDYETVALCRDKLAFCHFLQEAGLEPIPTYSKEDYFRGEAPLEFPCFVKPRYGAGSVSSQAVDSRTMLDELMGRNDTEYIIQPFIHGQEYGVNAYCDYDTGELLELFILKKISMRAGETFKSVSVHNDAIADMIHTLVRKMRFRGPVDIDIFESDGQYRILEVNPRFGGGYPHAYQCGINFPRRIAENLSGRGFGRGITPYPDQIIALRYTDIYVQKGIADEE